MALRPFPPYLLHRLYQRAPLNPSPTFRTRFLRKVGQDVLRTGGERILAVYAGIGSSVAVDASSGGVLALGVMVGGAGAGAGAGDRSRKGLSI